MLFVGDLDDAVMLISEAVVGLVMETPYPIVWQRVKFRGFNAESLKFTRNLPDYRIASFPLLVVGHEEVKLGLAKEHFESALSHDTCQADRQHQPNVINQGTNIVSQERAFDMLSLFRIASLCLDHLPPQRKQGPLACSSWLHQGLDPRWRPQESLG